VPRMDSLVCSRCGEVECYFQFAEKMCAEHDQSTGIYRWRWEMNWAQSRLAFIVAETGWATDGSLLQAVDLVERYVKDIKPRNPGGEGCICNLPNGLSNHWNSNCPYWTLVW
jgi:hypothetical protein